ncbi:MULTISPECIES: chorismate synthase [unclassified Streptomyces]|uniref:chorismate synthase n=1 Tax=unclassified Streptomyces TaxID=2593676 RepID=UPI00278BD02C|nr:MULTISPECIES: chorismate synthase [unclassified Streptomyces]
MNDMTTSTVGTVDDVAGLRAVAAFLADVWGMPHDAPPFHTDVLHSVAHAGGAVHAARSGGDVVGASVAVFGPPAERDVYSLAAAAGTSDRGIGHAVKQAQRAWALERGARTMRWTFDPLVARNARFNLVKLGAVASEYQVDFYGPMDDGINNGDETDRLTALWDLTADAPAPVEEADGRAAAPVLAKAPDGGPLAVRDDTRVWCRVPEDVVALRATDPDTALRWRHAVREVFTTAYAEGLRATAMSRDGWYTLTVPTALTASEDQA